MHASLGIHAIGPVRPLRSSRIAIAVVPLAIALVILAPSGTGLGASEAFACANAGKGTGRLAPAQAQRAVICLVNKRRANRNLPGLRVRKPLRAAARSHSRRMRNRRCFSHTCGGNLLRRVQRTPYLPCACTFSVGETIAWGAGARGKPRRIVKSWMRSGPHRRILMRRAFRHIGVGMVHGSPIRPNRRSHGTYTAILGFKR